MFERSLRKQICADNSFNQIGNFKNRFITKYSYGKLITMPLKIRFCLNISSILILEI